MIFPTVLKVGFEQLNYTVSESDGVLEVCVVVINPPPSADLDVTVAVNYRITGIYCQTNKGVHNDSIFTKFRGQQ